MMYFLQWLNLILHSILVLNRSDTKGFPFFLDFSLHSLRANIYHCGTLNLMIGVDLNRDEEVVGISNIFSTLDDILSSVVKPNPLISSCPK